MQKTYNIIQTLSIFTWKTLQETCIKGLAAPHSGFSVCGTKCGQGNFDYGEINSKAFHYDPKAGWIPNNSGEF